MFSAELESENCRVRETMTNKYVCVLKVVELGSIDCATKAKIDAVKSRHANGTAT
jgi:hypothetical protein